MKRIFILILLALFMVTGAQAESKDMWAAVYAKTATNEGNVTLTRISTGITFQVLQKDSDTEETLTVFADRTDTSITNPVSTSDFASSTVCGGKVKFRVDPGEAGDRYVDLIVVNTAGGYTAFVEDFDQYQHMIVLDQRANIQHHGVIWFDASTAAYVDTGIDFSYDTYVEAVRIDVVTTFPDTSLDVGTLSTESSGDASGFVVGISTAVAGSILPSLTTVGALLDDGTNFYPGGHAIVSAQARSLIYAGRSGGASLHLAVATAGYIHYWFTRVR